MTRKWGFPEGGKMICAGCMCVTRNRCGPAGQLHFKFLVLQQMVNGGEDDFEREYHFLGVVVVCLCT